MSFFQSLRDSLLLRLSMLGALILLLQLPIALIEGTLGERTQTRDQALRSVTDTWGDRQTLMGPVVVVPYREVVRDDKGVDRTYTRNAYFLPESLAVTGEMTSERRYRGIFEVPVYQAALELTGELKTPDFSRFDVAAHDIMWDQATLVVGITDPKAIRERVQLAWDQEALEFGPSRPSSLLPAGISVPLPRLGKERDATHKFQLKLKFGGSSELRLLPVGVETTFALKSDWPAPSFVGAYLPGARTIKDDGFTADWRVPHLGRNYPQSWRDDEFIAGTAVQSGFGVSLLSPVDGYTATTRAVKYQLLFVFMTFLLFYLIELFRKLRIHPVQYLLVGFALCVFYLLLLALSEHLGFDLAYALAAAAVVVLIGGYCLAILRSGRLAAIVAGELGVLYGFLYALLQIEDYALLVGSIGVFVVLAVVMFVTRKIDWYKPAGAS